MTALSTLSNADALTKSSTAGMVWYRLETDSLSDVTAEVQIAASKDERTDERTKSGKTSGEDERSTPGEDLFELRFRGDLSRSGFRNNFSREDVPKRRLTVPKGVIGCESLDRVSDRSKNRRVLVKHTEYPTSKEKKAKSTSGVAESNAILFG